VTHAEIRAYLLNELPEVERRIEFRTLTQPMQERLVLVLRAAYRNMGYEAVDLRGIASECDAVD
jgi:hypothetical protein